MQLCVQDKQCGNEKVVCQEQGLAMAKIASGHTAQSLWDLSLLYDGTMVVMAIVPGPVLG